MDSHIIPQNHPSCTCNTNYPTQSGLINLSHVSITPRQAPRPAASVSPPPSGPTYRRVRRRKSSGKWVSEIREPKTPNRIWLGTFPTRRWQRWRTMWRHVLSRGKKRSSIFRTPLLPCPCRLPPPRDIQAAAASAAAAARAAVDALVRMEPAGEMEREFVDEDLIFDLPNVVASMAEGMMMSPPRIDDGFDGPILDELYLWNYP